ncbi:PREDICTED: plastid division protein PDV1-like [Camelina sativa]|uniref:Plastid division protein PDV1-like n=1 Tax=Camelina sativa TaxID=90675 RepID=A0ABM0USQ9_CAMSA|nr:PREDICTED: plastid division protein PDV1-like [Camelina sativa]
MGEMEIEEIEAVLEKIWDLHDKLSDEIHLISRSHFLKSVKPSNRSEKRKTTAHHHPNGGDDNRPGYVFIKGFAVDDNDDSTMREAKSLNAIRTALENLEDQLEFFHTIHTQQRTERDVAVARLEQSRILLAMRLAEHHGKNYGVLEEALAFVGSIKTASHFVSPDHLYESLLNATGANSTPSDGQKSNFVINAFASTFGFAKRALGFNHVRGVLGNAAIFAISMVAMLHLHQVATNERHVQKKEDRFYRSQQGKTYGRRGEMSSGDRSLDHLDVMMARG